MLIKNKQPERIYLTYNDICVEIPGNCSKLICFQGEGFITIRHSDFEVDDNNKFDKMVDSFVKSTVLIVDSVLYCEKCFENSFIEVKNNVYEHSTGDFGYLYFDIFANNCNALLWECKTTNKRAVLRTQKLIRFGESFGFPPFSTVIALLRYLKIRRMCNEKIVLQTIKNKQVEHRDG